MNKRLYPPIPKESSLRITKNHRVITLIVIAAKVYNTFFLKMHHLR